MTAPLELDASQLERHRDDGLCSCRACRNRSPGAALRTNTAGVRSQPCTRLATGELLSNSTQPMLEQPESALGQLGKFMHAR